MRPSRKTLPLSSLVLAVCALVAGCGEQKAEQACEDYYAALKMCGAEFQGLQQLQSSCKDAAKENLEAFECLRDWAEGGCKGAEAVAACGGI